MNKAIGIMKRAYIFELISNTIAGKIKITIRKNVYEIDCHKGTILNLISFNSSP